MIDSRSGQMLVGMSDPDVRRRWEATPPVRAEQLRVDRPRRLSVCDRRRGDVPHTEAEPTRARELRGLRPQVDFAEGYAREVRWLAQRQREHERQPARTGAGRSG